MAEAQAEAERAIFVAREGLVWDKFLDILDDMDRKMFGFVSVAMPFRRTPGNEIREFLRATPLGLINAHRRFASVHKMTGDVVAARAAAFDEVGRVVTGSALLLAMGGMLKSGLVKVNQFRRGDSRAQRDTENAAGIRQDMIQIGDTQIPITNLGPLGRAFSIADDIVNTDDEATALEKWRQGTVGVIAQMADEAFVQSGIQLFDAMRDDDRARKFAQQFGGSFVPRPIKEAFRLVDPTVRETEGGFLAGVGRAVGKGTPKLGLFGDEIKRDVSPAGLAVGAEPLGQDVTAQKMLEIGAVHAAPTSLRDIELPTDQDLAHRKAKGQVQRQFVERVMNNPRFLELSLENQRRLVDRAYTQASQLVDRRAKVMVARGLPINEQALRTGKLGL